MAMDTLAAVSSVISVVGLAGQVLQGYNYLRSIVDSAKDSPEDLRLLTSELEIISQIVESIKYNSEASSTESEIEQYLAGQPLVLCDETLAKLRQTVEEYGDINEDEASGVKRYWKSLSFALSAGEIRKHVENSDRAKDHLLAIQSLSSNM